MSTTISKKIYELLRSKLLAGQYRPGVRISEFAIAKELGVSRSPIREAISILISDGLVEKHSGIGAFVKIPNLREIEEIFVLREMLECYTVKETTKKINHNQIQQLGIYCDEIYSVAKELRLKSRDKKELIRKVLDADLAFHMLIMTIADNQQIIKIIENFRILTSIFSLYFDTQFDLREVAQIWHEHTRILQSIRNSDPEKAAIWVKKQIRRSKNLAISGHKYLTSTHKPVWLG